MRTMSAFGEVEVAIIWDGSAASMPGWEQQSYTSSEHIPGSNRSDVFLMGLGPLTRTFTVLCDTASHYRNLRAMVQTEATLRVPAAMSDIAPSREVDYFGVAYAEIDDVTLISLNRPQVWVDGAVTVEATFQVDAE